MFVVRKLVALLGSAILASCGGLGSTDQPSEAPFSIGRLQSEGPPSAPLSGENLSAWLVSRVANGEEIYLSTRTAPFADGGKDRWAVTIRVDQALIPGTLSASAASVRLFSRYWNDCCLNRADQYGSFETYDHSYAAVAGTVTFRTDREGSFDLRMQEESPLRSGIFIGPTFQLRGCWHIGGERVPSGCTVPGEA